jgi:hypothetical protein
VKVFVVALVASDTSIDTGRWPTVLLIETLRFSRRGAAMCSAHLALPHVAFLSPVLHVFMQIFR